MLNISGYQIRALVYESAYTYVYRAVRERDSAPVILKTASAEQATEKRLARLRHEYDLLKGLEIPGVIRCYALEEVAQCAVLVFADSGGSSVRTALAGQPMPIDRFLPIAIQLTQALGALHAAGIIHKDINPGNIVLGPNEQPEFIDFGLASRLPRTTLGVRSPSLLEGTLAYISPEQTGRMNRSIDYRSDFYSLGMTFYEMLTGQPAFSASDPLELIHCHIAKAVMPPHERNSQIPEVLSRIISKLVAKTAEQRYQSAYGLLYDLRNFQEQFQKHEVADDFVIGGNDVSSQLLLPQQLYGRQAETAELLAAFSRTLHGATELILVNGYSGIGKSSLVNELQKPIVAQHGYFASGKFDQLRQDVPYQPILYALDELIRQILLEGEERIGRWRKLLLAALSPNAQVLSGLIPSLEHLIGKSADVPELGYLESQQRMSLVFRRFCSVFAEQKHPLVMFLDDLQWADSASLALLKSILCVTTPGLLIIGAYRDHETSRTHPLIIMLEDIGKAGATPIHTLTLKPLTSADTNRFVADALHRSAEEVVPLADLLEQKTHGNPFFISQLLSELYKEGLLHFDSQAGLWQWNLEQIQQASITDNVVELMLGKIAKLESQTQEVLELAACIGNQFSVKTLSLLAQESRIDIRKALWRALKEGLIIPLAIEASAAQSSADPLQDGLPEEAAPVYRFLHDRVQQAAYARLSKERQQQIRLRIGRLLWKHQQDATSEDSLFDILGHLHAGIDLVTDLEERIAIARLALEGGRRALSVMALQTAQHCLRFGVQLLPSDGWQTLRDLSFELYLDLAHCEYLTGDYQQAEKLLHPLLQHSVSRYELTEVRRRLMLVYMHTGHPNALNIGLEGLQPYGIFLTKDPDEKTVADLFRQVKDLLQNRQVGDLLQAPLATTAEDAALARLLLVLNSAAYLGSILLVRAVGTLSGILAIQRGTTKYSAAFYSFLGVQLAGIEEYQLAYEFGKLSCDLLNRYDNPEIRGRVLFTVSATQIFYREHLRKTLELLSDGAQACIQSGDILYGACCGTFVIESMWIIGKSLLDTQTESAKWLSYTKQYNAIFFKYHLFSAELAMHALRGDSTLDARGLTAEELQEFETVLPSLPSYFRGLHYERLSTVAYIMGDYAAAATAIEKSEECLSGLLPHFQGYDHYFHQALILLATLPSLSEAQQSSHLAIIQRNFQKLQVLAQQAPMNYAHKYLLIAAELSAMQGELRTAMDLYDQAIDQATEHGYIHNAAIANECAGRFYLRIGRRTHARAHLSEAYSQYQIWGALSKLKRMSEEFRNLLLVTSGTDWNTAATNLATISQTLENEQGLDMLTVAKAAQAISSEIHMGPLLEQLLRITLENAGAERGIIILRRDDELWIEASGSAHGPPIEVLRSLPVRDCQDLPETIIRYVARTEESIVLENASTQGAYANDPYVVGRKIKSLLCMPTINQGKLSGIVYLENNLTEGAFTAQRLEVLRILSTQIAISIDNASLYANLEQKVLERTAELRAAQERLLVLERESTERQLAGGFAHEMRNALAGPRALMFRVLGSGQSSEEASLPAVALHNLEDVYQLVQENLADEPLYEIEKRLQTVYDGQEYLQKTLPIIHRAICRGLGITQQIMDYAKLGQDASPAEAVDLNSVITEVLSELQEQFTSATIQLELDLAQPLRSICGWELQLYSVVKNLLLNAYDAVTSKQRDPDAARHLRIYTKQQNSAVLLGVSDSGIGIEAENLQRIFEPFFTTKPDTGTGLGLALTKKIIAMHRGTISVRSTVGVGTEIEVSWPDSSTQ